MKKIVKMFSLFLLIFFSIFSCGCDGKSPYLTFNSDPINAKNVYNAQKVFKPEQTIHYALLMPKGFKEEYLRMQILNVSDKVPVGGVSIYMAKDIFVNKDKKFHFDKFVIRKEGTYYVRFFYGNKAYKPFVENIIWVKS